MIDKENQKYLFERLETIVNEFGYVIDNMIMLKEHFEILINSYKDEIV